MKVMGEMCQLNLDHLIMKAVMENRFTKFGFKCKRYNPSPTQDQLGRAKKYYQLPESKSYYKERMVEAWYLTRINTRQPHCASCRHYRGTLPVGQEEGLPNG